MKKRRVLLKISGEAFSSKEDILCEKRLHAIVKDIETARAEGVEIAIVVGGGNFLRGAHSHNALLKRITADHMGMISTILNGLVLRDAFESYNLPCKLFSAFAISGIVPAFDYNEVIATLNQNTIAIFCGGTGNPFVTTDSGASLRAAEIKADVLLKATKVDGVFDKDPQKFANASRFECLNFTEVLQKELQVMDLQAFYQCREHNISIQIFNLFKEGALLKALLGKAEGTIISNERGQQDE